MENEITIKSVVDNWLSKNCNEHKEKKNGFDYVPWAYAWMEALKIDPKADFVPVLTPDGLDYWSDGKTARVYVDVTILGETKRMWLPVMDYRNISIPVEKITSKDVNNSIMRCAVKGLSKFGLGLYIFAGEDLPEGAEDDNASKTSEKAPSCPPKVSTPTATPPTAKAPQSGSNEASAMKAAAKAAWDLFVTMDSVKSMDENSKKTFFKSYVKSAIGDKDLSKVSVAEWNQVYARIKANKEG